MQFCFLEYKGDTMPQRKEIEYMVDQAYVHSDITPIPMLSDFRSRMTNVSEHNNKKIYTPNNAKFGRVKEYLKNAIEVIEQLNNKPIMGYIPDYRVYFGELLELYIDKGINTFYFDAHLANPITLQIPLRTLLRELNRQNALETSFIHMINHDVGRVIKNSTIVPAKDILGYGLGIDSLGNKHMKTGAFFAMQQQANKSPDNRSRLFNKDTYGYIKTASNKEIRDFYPNDSSIPIDEFLISGRPDTKIQNAFNTEQLAMESTTLQNKIREPKSVLQYIDKKSDIKDEDIKILKKAKIKDDK